MFTLKLLPSSKTVVASCTKLVSTNAKLSSVQAEADAKKLEYYRNLKAQHGEETFPPNWNEALPFEAIPGPKPLPIVGNLWRFMPRIGDFYGQDFRDVVKSLRGKYGDIFIIKGLVTVPNVVHVFDPKDIEAVFRNDGPWPERWGLPSLLHYKRVLRKDLYKNREGVFTTQGEDWFKFRSVINPILMKPKNVMLYVDKINSVADQLVDNMTYFASTNSKKEMPENFTHELHKWSLESISVITLDRGMGCLNRNLSPDSEPAKMIRYGTELMDLIYKLDIVPSIWKSAPTWKRFVHVMDELTRICVHYTNEAKAKLEESADISGEQRSMLQQLLERNPDYAFITALDMLLAGIDTTARVLAAALYFMAKNPDKQMELRAEAMRLLPSKDSPVTAEALANAHYLKAVIKETTRLSPIGATNQRTTQKNMVLAGYQIPKGSFMATNNLAISLDEKYVPRAAEFLPERWLRTTTGDLSFKNMNQFIHLPFGFGPRSCIGKRVANFELEVTLLKIVRKLELSWHHPDMVFGGKLLYGVLSPLRLQVNSVN